MTDDRPIADERELIDSFRAGEKPVSSWRVGIEHEKIGVYGDGRAVPYEGAAGIGVLLDHLASHGAYEPLREEDHLIALARGDGKITLEPGGQLELSGATVEDSYGAIRQLGKHMAELAAVSAELGIRWLAIGFRPFGRLEDVPWMPKGRYRIMRAYLPTRGRLAHEMMKRTATAQVNLDYCDEADAARKLRTAMGVTSLVTAMFANSPIVDGQPSGFQSYRAAAWLETDPDRCGLLPFSFDAADDIFTRYTAWALDVPMFFVYRKGYIPAQGISFRRFLREGFAGTRATLTDWQLHLSTLFPEVRLKNYIELRGADAGPLEVVHALAALSRGLLYDRQALDAAWQLCAGWTLEEREQLRREVPRRALEAQVHGHRVRDLARELLAIAKTGLERLSADEARLLAPLERIVAEARTGADFVLAAHEQAGGDAARLIAALKH